MGVLDDPGPGERKSVSSPANFSWDVLLGRIAGGNCTPFLGAGVSHPPLPTGRELSCQLAAKYAYPLTDDSNLMNVSQYAAMEVGDPVFPKEEIARVFKATPPPDFSRDFEPHAVLADLPLPLYLTTNYDGFMADALLRAQRNVVREICRWNSELRRSLPAYLATHQPTPSQPVVFHLHGHVDKPSSLVLTEDDYLDFMVNVKSDDTEKPAEQMVIPPIIQESLASTSLLFVGYGLRDWNLRLLLRALVAHAESTLRRVSVSVQLHPEDTAVKPNRLADAQRFLDSYFGALQVRVYWGSADDFLRELKTRWDEFKRR